MLSKALLCRLFAVLSLSFAVFNTANADTFTLSGNLAADNSVVTFALTNISSQNYSFFTTSYGGGTNANGSRTAAGGFVPVLTLFSSAGMPVGFGGGDGTCHGAAKADPTTGLCEDASFSQLLAPGSYILTLSEFPNVALGNFSDGFLADGDTHFTGTNCSKPGGSFLQADLAPCVQRTSSYSVNYNSGSISAVPEPSTLLLVGPTAAALALFGRRKLAQLANL